MFPILIVIPMGTNCVPLLPDLFLYKYEAEFIQGSYRTDKTHLTQKSKFTCRYMYKDKVLSLDNLKISEAIDFIYSCELEIKFTIKSSTSVSY